MHRVLILAALAVVGWLLWAVLIAVVIELMRKFTEPPLQY